jgi:hypothetical protein
MQPLGGGGWGGVGLDLPECLHTAKLRLKPPSMQYMRLETFIWEGGRSVGVGGGPAVYLGWGGVGVGVGGGGGVRASPTEWSRLQSVGWLKNTVDEIRLARVDNIKALTSNDVATSTTDARAHASTPLFS